MTAELARLADVPAARARLDEQELTLIERARVAGQTWADIAGALGLASRQAAEQRSQRLRAMVQARRQDEHHAYAPELAAIRLALADLQKWIGADRRWDARFTRAALVRATVATALQATPGALYALAEHVAADLTGAGAPRLPAPAHTAAARLRDALSRIH
jgi:hypothetical protein